MNTSPSRKLKQKFWNKRVNAEKEGIEFLLTLSDFISLMEESSLTIDDLHIKGYHLSRFGDTGPYSIDNCRFVHYLVNYAEKKVSDKARAASRQNILNYNLNK